MLGSNSIKDLKYNSKYVKSKLPVALSTEIKESAVLRLVSAKSIQQYISIKLLYALRSIGAATVLGFEPSLPSKVSPIVASSTANFCASKLAPRLPTSIFSVPVKIINKF